MGKIIYTSLCEIKRAINRLQSEIHYNKEAIKKLTEKQRQLKKKISVVYEIKRRFVKIENDE